VPRATPLAARSTGWGPLVPAKAGTQIWIPAYAGMSGSQQ
jgi:hypothetical protein